MNLKFYELPTEKQEIIINAAYRVFAENSYKKLPCQKSRGKPTFLKAYYFNTLRTSELCI